MNINDVDLVVSIEIFPEAGNEDIHASAYKITVIFPDGFLHEIPFDQLVPVL